MILVLKIHSAEGHKASQLWTCYLSGQQQQLSHFGASVLASLSSKERQSTFLYVFQALFPTLSSNKQKTAWLHSRVWTLVPFTDWLCLNMNHFHWQGKENVIKTATLHPHSGHGPFGMRHFTQNALLHTTLLIPVSSFFVLSFCWCFPLETLCPLIVPLFRSCLLQNKIKDTRLISVFAVFFHSPSLNALAHLTKSADDVPQFSLI